MLPKRVPASAFICLVILGAFISFFCSINSGLALIGGFAVSYFQQADENVKRVNRVAKLTLAWAIVGFGLTITLSTIGVLTVQYFFQTCSGILLALTAAYFGGKVLQIDSLLSLLVGVGTAICGASAIAAVGNATKASAEKMSMALGTVLVLNALALIIFPFLGHALSLSPHDFGVWAALAIHDTSSVVGAAMSFDPSSLETATTIKLARALWIVPVTAFCAHVFVKNDERKSFQIPWFIWGYLLAAAVGSFLPMSLEARALCSATARSAFRAGLFLTGAGVNLKSVLSLGTRPFFLGVLLWILSAGWSLYVILHFAVPSV